MKYQFHLTFPRSSGRYLMEAFFSIQPLQGFGEEGYELSHKSIISFLKQNGIVYGIQEKTIAKIIQEKTAKQELIALGVYPERGQDVYFEKLLDASENNFEKLLEVYDGHKETWFWPEFKKILISANTPLLRKYPPTLGSPGMSIRGELVSGLSGYDKSFPKLKNVKVSEEDKNLLVSTVEGYPVFNLPHSIVMQPIFVLERDITESHYYQGIVAVNGSVKDLIRLGAEGDIIVKGTVDAAVLISGGHILIGQGIKGKDTAILKASKSIRTGFAEHCTLEADYSIYAHDLIQSYSVALDAVHAENIIGGITRATGVVQASWIGSAGLNTQLAVGLNPYLEDKINLILRQIKAIDQHLAEIRNQISELVLKEKKGPDDIMLRHLRGRIPRFEFQLLSLQARLETLKKFQTEQALSEIKSLKRIHSGTELFMGEFEYYVEKNLNKPIVYKAGKYGVVSALAEA